MKVCNNCNQEYEKAGKYKFSESIHGLSPESIRVGRVDGVFPICPICGLEEDYYTKEKPDGK